MFAMIGLACASEIDDDDEAEMHSQWMKNLWQAKNTTLPDRVPFFNIDGGDYDESRLAMLFFRLSADY